MAFVDFDMIKTKIHSSLWDIISPPPVGEGDPDTSVFDEFEAEAASMVNRISGIEIPEETSDTEPWLVPVIAFIIQYNASAAINNKSQELLNEIQKKYDYAMNALNAQTLAPPADDANFKLAKVGEIIGEESFKSDWESGFGYL